MHFPTGLGGTEPIDRHARHGGDQKGLRGANLVSVRLRPPEPRILDDVLVYHLPKPDGSSQFMMVVNASNREKIRDWIAANRDQVDEWLAAAAG